MDEETQTQTTPQSTEPAAPDAAAQDGAAVTFGGGTADSVLTAVFSFCGCAPETLCDKMFHHFVPYAVISCSAIKTPYRIMRRIVMRQYSPLAACLYDIQHCFYQ